MVNKRKGVEPAKLIGAPMRKGSRQRRRMTSFFSSKSMNASLRLNLMGHVLQLSTIRTTNSHRVEDEISLPDSFHGDYANGWGQHAVQGNHSSPLLSSQTNDFIVLNTTRKAEPTCQAIIPQYAVKDSSQHPSVFDSRSYKNWYGKRN